MNLTAKFRPVWIGYFRSLVVIVLAVSVMAAPLWAADKTDEIWLKNGDHLTGEIKKLQLGVFYFKPKYALNSIEIDWGQVDRIETVDRFNVIFTNGETHSGVIRKAPEKDGSMDFTINDDGQIVATEKLEVVNIQPQKSSFVAQLNGSIDYGFSYVSGNNQLQSSLGANVAYRGEKNQMSSSLSSSFSGQSDAEDTTRESWTSDYTRILTPKYFVTGLGALLSSSQQQLDLRVTFGGAFGRTLMRTDRTAFSAAFGAVASREKYTSDAAAATTSTGTNPETTSELLGTLDFTNFKFDAYNVTSSLRVYPSLSTWGRVRFGSETNVSWEFIKDLYWNLRVYENFDSKPPINAPKNDFGITTGLGWKF
jgi:putative salt-induced outer membrane protein YdiY